MGRITNTLNREFETEVGERAVVLLREFPWIYDLNPKTPKGLINVITESLLSA